LQDPAILKLIIDVRPPELFDIGYIKTALNIPVPDIPDDQPLNLVKLSETLLPSKGKTFNARGLLFTHIIVYDGNGEGRPARRLVSTLLQEGKMRCVRLLQGGYQNFAVQHPFLTSTSLLKAVGGQYPSSIVDGFLYLGGFENARNKQQLQDLGISHIINSAGEIENQFPNDFKYLSFKIDDTPNTNIAEHFAQAVQFIEEAKAASSKVLVHCAMGISRSSSIVIAYLMHDKGWTYEQAHEFVRSLRSCIRPNPGFMAQLVSLEQQLNASKQTGEPFSAMELSPIESQEPAPSGQQALQHIV